MVDIVLTYIVTAYMVMVDLIIAYIVTAYVVMAYIVMAYVAMACIVMAYIVMASVSTAASEKLEAVGHLCRINVFTCAFTYAVTSKRHG